MLLQNRGVSYAGAYGVPFAAVNPAEVQNEPST